MSNPRLIIKILNLVNAVLMIAFMLKSLHVVSFLGHIKIYHMAIAVLAVYGLKSWIELANKVGDPVKENKITNMVFNVGFAILVGGITFKIMHWPYDVLMLITGSVMVFLANVLSFVLDSNTVETDPEILDDLE